MIKAQVMLSYRVADTGTKELGGDGTAVQIRAHLAEQGYTVYLNESVLQGGHDWSREIHQAVSNCEVFVMVCSEGYGENKWTFGEFQVAEAERKPIVPLWHSGIYPPPPLKVMISSYLRVPKGGKPLVQCDFELAMKQLETRLAQLGCKPSRPPGLEWRPGPSPPQEREKPLSRSEARAKALAKTAQHAAAVRDATKPSTTPSNCLRKLMGHEGEITALCWGTDNRTLVSGGTDRHAIVWEISTGRTRHLLTGHRHEVIAIGYTADGRKLITSGEEGTTRVWCADDPEREPPMVLAGDGSLTTVCLYPDSFHAVTCSTDRSVRVWNTWLGARERLLRLRDNVGVILRLSPDGTMLAASGHPPTVWVFKESTLEDLKSMTGHVDRVTSLAWSPDGKLLVTGSRDKNARVWEVATGTCLSTFTGHTEVVTVVCWSPDGRLIATGGEDRTMRVWDVATGFCRRVLSSHGAEVTCLAWSPDGRYVATGCADKLVRVWS